jgi:hypothetical protein
MTDKYLSHEEMLEIAEQRERENEEATNPKSLGTSLEQWWDSEAHKQLQEASEATVQRALEKYSMLSEDDKYDMVQAICHIMCEAEKKGVSHRGLMDELGIYPSGFWILELLTVHNSLWSYYHDKKQKEELERDLKTLQDLTET